MWGSPKVWDPFVGGLPSKDCNILGLGVPVFSETTTYNYKDPSDNGNSTIKIRMIVS